MEDDPQLRAAAASQPRALGYQVRPVGSANFVTTAQGGPSVHRFRPPLGAMDARRLAEKARALAPALKLPVTSGNPIAGAKAALLTEPCRHQHHAAALRDVLGTTDPPG